MPKNQKSNNIIFPENTVETVLGILNKYGIQETPQEIVDKLAEGTLPFLTQVSDLIKRVTAKQITEEEFEIGLQTSLSLSQEQAKKLGAELIGEIVAKAENVEELPLNNSEESSSANMSKKRSAKDAYREPTE